MKFCKSLVVFCICFFGSSNFDKKVERIPANKRADYAILVSKDTFQDKNWKQVVEALQKKHDSVTLVYSEKVIDVQKDLSEIFPRYACFVARPEECGRSFVLVAHRLTRALDDDPYGDCIWGIITGYDAGDALRIAKHKEPLCIKRVAAGCGVDLESFVEGVFYSECEKGVMYERSKGNKQTKKSCPNDTTNALVNELNNNKPDMFCTSGHASHKVWELGYSYKNGIFGCREGNLIGQDTERKQYEIKSENPKIYCAQGNCLVGLIPEKNCMALAWMRSGGVHQLAGYTVSTWYGYMGWGINDYFVKLGNQFTFAESFYLTNQSLIHELMTKFPKTSKNDIEEFNIEQDHDLLNKLAKKHGIKDKDNLGLLWDRDTLAFYGDPAWEARLEKVKQPIYELTLKESRNEFTTKIETNMDGEWGQRKPIVLLPCRVKDVRLGLGKEFSPLITDNFVLLPFSGKFKAKQVFKISFNATKLAGPP